MSVARLISTESGSFSAVPRSGTFSSYAVAEIPILKGSAVAVWEVLSSNPSSIEDFDFPVWFGTNSSAPGVATVNGSMAPNPSQDAFSKTGADAASTTLPVPRFVDSSQALTVLQVTSPPTLTANPSGLAFTYQIVSAMPAAQSITVAAAAANSGLAFTAAPSSSGNWLSVTPLSGSLPVTLSVWVSPGSLAADTYGGSVVVSVPEAANSPLTIPVTLKVSETPTVTQTISHIADGAGWKTTIILVNMDKVAAKFTLTFRDEGGGGWKLPLGADGIRTEITDTIPIRGSRTIQTDGIANALQVGWGELSSTNSIGGTAIFANQVPGQPDSEAAVPITRGASKRFLLPFDNSSGAGTGVAVANPSGQSANISVIFRDPSGQQTGTAGPYNIAAHGHISFVLPASAGTQGAAEFASVGADVVALGIRGHGRAFTSLEALSSVPAGGKTISHLADGGGWKTTIILVNTDSQTAPFTLRFWADNGTPLLLALGTDGLVSQLTGTIAPGGSRTIRTNGTAASLATGWAELVTSYAVGGTAIFGAQIPGQPDSEAAAPIVAGAARQFMLPFDGSPGMATGVALANPSATQAAKIEVACHNVFGQPAGSAITYVAPPNGHISVVLAASAPGVAMISSPDVPVAALGIRSHNGAFTSVRTQIPDQ